MKAIITLGLLYAILSVLMYGVVRYVLHNRIEDIIRVTMREEFERQERLGNVFCNDC